MPCPTARIACSDPQLATHLRRLFGDCEVIEDPRHCSQAPLCRWLDDAPLGPAGEVQAALAEAVATLERTRHFLIYFLHMLIQRFGMREHRLDVALALPCSAGQLLQGVQRIAHALGKATHQLAHLVNLAADLLD